MLRYARALLAVSALAVLVPALASEAHAQVTKAPAPAKKGAAAASANAPAKSTPAAPAKAEAKSDGRAEPKGEPKAEPKSEAKGEAKGKLGEAEVTAEVARVQANYEKVRSFRARFKQDYWVKAYDQRKKSTGTVVFARPGKMSWSYEEPKGNRVVSDGKLLRVYEEGAKQLFEQPVDKSQYPQALGFLTGESKLAETFTFEGNEGASMSFPGGIVLVATPRQPLATVQKVLLYVDAATHYVRRVLLLDAQGNRNRFDFDDVKLDDTTDAREFSFTPPAGTTVIHP